MAALSSTSNSSTDAEDTEVDGKDPERDDDESEPLGAWWWLPFM